ncbi:MAG: hypothetical protein IK144_12150 [Bacteroidaceae bacterium]|nr:hypothetical protein [Bacteroidaceae bacterium]
MTFHSIIRQWCRTYKPMLDNSGDIDQNGELDSDKNGNRRFYLTDSTAGVVELAKGISNSFSPCVVMESNVEGYIDGGRIYRNYPVYFFVRARDMADGDAAAEAKEEAWWHAQNFLTWLRKRHDEDSPNGEYGRIDLEDNLDMMTVGPIENGWFAVLIQITRLELLDLCVNEDLYVEELDESSM